MIDWYSMPTWTVFQPYGGVNKFYLLDTYVKIRQMYINMLPPVKTNHDRKITA
jgi:hypothetical protein